MELLVEFYTSVCMFRGCLGNVCRAQSKVREGGRETEGEKPRGFPLKRDELE